MKSWYKAYRCDYSIYLSEKLGGKVTAYKKNETISEQEVKKAEKSVNKTEFDKEIKNIKGSFDSLNLDKSKPP